MIGIAKDLLDVVPYRVSAGITECVVQQKGDRPLLEKAPVDKTASIAILIRETPFRKNLYWS